MLRQREQNEKTMKTEKTSHDHLFKTLLETFLDEYLLLVYPPAVPLLDIEKSIFAKQEHYLDLPKGDYQEIDILANVPRRDGSGRVLIHIEIEGKFLSEFKERIWAYHLQISLRHRLPVLPSVVFLSGGPPGLKEENYTTDFLGRQTSQFSYLSLGLSGSSAEEYLKRPEALCIALASKMRFAGTRAEHKLACIKKVYEAKVNEARRFLLWNCVNTYLTLTVEEQKEYETLLAKTPQGVNTMELTYADQLEARGKAAGKAETLVEIVEARGLKLTKEEKEKILTCQDLTQLKAWASQVSSIKKASDLFAPPSSKKTTPKKKH